MTDLPTIGAIAPWYGSNRMHAGHVGRKLEGCSWVGVVFAGSMAELKYISARTLVVNDRHEALMNLARVMSCENMGAKLYRRLRRRLFHPDELARAQKDCEGFDQFWDRHSPSVGWAEAYFVAVWMGRSANAGTKNELKGKTAVRWNAKGGDSAVRFQNAVRSIPAWRRLLRRCTFQTLDALEFLTKCKDEPTSGIYCDPPFPGPGDKYKHTIDERYHGKLVATLEGFTRARIVCRFYDHPLVRQLYGGPGWCWHTLEGRDQANETKPEVLIVRNGNDHPGDYASPPYAGCGAP